MSAWAVRMGCLHGLPTAQQKQKTQRRDIGRAPSLFLPAALIRVKVRVKNQPESESKNLRVKNQYSRIILAGPRIKF
jgi:hypothetical protein